MRLRACASKCSHVWLTRFFSSADVGRLDPPRVPGLLPLAVRARCLWPCVRGRTGGGRSKKPPAGVSSPWLAWLRLWPVIGRTLPPTQPERRSAPRLRARASGTGAVRNQGMCRPCTLLRLSERWTCARAAKTTVHEASRRAQTSDHSAPTPCHSPRPSICASPSEFGPEASASPEHNEVAAWHTLRANYSYWFAVVIVHGRFVSNKISLFCDFPRPSPSDLAVLEWDEKRTRQQRRLS